MNRFFTAFSIIVLLIASGFGQAPAKAQHPGAVLFQKRKYSDAVRALEIAVTTPEFRSDAETWNYLGLSYLATNELKKGRKAFEKSVSLSPSNAIFLSNLSYAYLMARQSSKAVAAADKATGIDSKLPGPYEVRSTVNLWRSKLDAAEADADKFIQLDPGNPQAYLLKSDVLIAKLGERFNADKSVNQGLVFLRDASQTLKTGSSKCKDSPICEQIDRRTEAITAFYEHFSRDPTPPTPPTPVAAPEPGVTPIKIIRQPPAKYTDRARSENIQGAIRVVLLMGASGRVEHILFLSRLGYGLDEEVIKAVHDIKFEPKMKDGKSVSTVIVREYTFSIY
jgi:TonB family protein